jgi:hypothetical protein
MSAEARAARSRWPGSYQHPGKASATLSWYIGATVERMIERKSLLAIAGFTIAALLATVRVAAQNPPSPDEYAAHVGGGAQVIGAGKLTAGHIGERGAAAKQPLLCGHRPTVLDGKLDDYGAAYPGFLILNPKLLSKVSPAVRQWIFAHECGHQYRGPDEETADCFAVQRGRRYGWLTPEGLEEVCRFIAPAKGDMMHFSGSHRCESMRRCYADPAVK